MSNRPSPNAWIPYAGFMLAVAGIVYQSGQLTGDVKSNTERIARLEVAQAASAADVNSIKVSTARIEAKLDLLVSPERKPER